MRSSSIYVVVVLAILCGTAFTRVDPTFGVEEAGTVAVSLPLFGPAEVDLPVKIRETSEKAVDMVAPKLVSLKRDSGAGQITVTPSSVEVLHDGKPVAGIPLAAWARDDLVVRVRGLAEAGTYTAQIAVGAAATGGEVTTPVTVKVRSKVAVAWLLILAGVALSALLRYLIVTYQDGLRARARIGLLNLRLRQTRDTLGELDEDERRVLRSVADQIDELAVRLEAQDRPAPAQFDECARKVPGVRSFVACARRMSDVDDQSARNLLDVVKLWLETPVDADTIVPRREAAEKALTDLSQAINAAASPLGRQIAALQTDIDQALAAARKADRSDAIDALEPAKRNLLDARAALAANLAEAKRLYDQASAVRGTYGVKMGSARTVEDATVREPVTADASNPLRDIGKKSRRAELVVTIAVALVAVLLGQQLLYENQLAWGSSLDKIAAFLWGLGLHPVGGTVFGGIESLGARISGGSAKE